MEHTKTKLTLHERLTSIGVRYWTLVCLLACIDVLGPMATDAHLPSLPQMTHNLDTSPSWIQFTILSYTLVMAISSLFGGVLSDKYGRRNMTLFGLFAFICGGYGCTFSSNIWMLNICRLIQGIGGGISSIITSSVARDVFLANERMKILGILGSIRPIGVSISPMIGGWIAALHGWRMVFFITSSFAVIVIILSMWLLPETKDKFFVNYNKIRILHTETKIRGNIDILPDESNYNMDINTNKAEGNIVVVDDDDDDEDEDEYEDEYEDDETEEESVDDDDEWSGIPMHATQSHDSGVLTNKSKMSDSSPSILINVGGSNNTLPLTNNTKGDIMSGSLDTLPKGYWAIWKIACSDSILMTVSWIIAFRMVGVFVFLNEFPYVSTNIYHYGQQISGLLIGAGSIFTILGASVAIISDRDKNANGSDVQSSERSSLLFKLAKKNAKLSIMRMASIASLIACLLLIVPPILMHYSLFLDILEINAHINHLELINEIYTKNAWYFLVIPFCVLTFSQGLFIPPATVVVVEPYPHIAASISAILQFWRILLPTITLIIITQCLSYNTNSYSSIVIHGIVGLCSFLCFVLMYGCISGHDVRLRMCGWQDRIENNDKLLIPINQSGIVIDSTYGTHESVTNSNVDDDNNNNNNNNDIYNIHTKTKHDAITVDVSTSIPPIMEYRNSNAMTDSAYDHHHEIHESYFNNISTATTTTATMYFSNTTINNNNHHLTNNNAAYDPFASNAVVTMQF